MRRFPVKPSQLDEQYETHTAISTYKSVRAVNERLRRGLQAGAGREEEEEEAGELE